MKRIRRFPLLCTGYGKPMRIIDFVTEVGSPALNDLLPRYEPDQRVSW